MIRNTKQAFLAATNSWALLAVCVLGFLANSTAVAQPPPGLGEEPPVATEVSETGDEAATYDALPFADEAFPTVGGDMAGGFGGFGFGGPKIEYSASFKLDETGAKGRLSVRAMMQDAFYTYSLNRTDGPSLPTSLELESGSISLTGPFTPSKSPKIDTKEFDGKRLEKHYGEVTWTAPFVAKRPLEESAKINVKVEGQVCGNGTCEPVDETLSAKFAGRYQAASGTPELRAKDTHATWTITLSSDKAKPGDTIEMLLSARVDEGYHVYRFVPGDPDDFSRTLFVADTKSGLHFGTPETDAKLESESLGKTSIEYFNGDVEWRMPITIPESAEPGEYPIEMQVVYQTCTKSSCDPPAGMRAVGKFEVAEKVSGASPQKLLLSEMDYLAIVEHPRLVSWIDEEPATEQTIEAEDSPLTAWHLLLALGGGFILNFMPCVLPVIGLKVLSFVDQAGNDHRRVIVLNLAFVAGILAVMLALGFLTVGVKAATGSAFGWGQQFTNLPFKVSMAALVFAMSLSFLGVWEIPIPGFAMSSKSNEMMQKEGLTGAFLKGILTTVLATPCSGPMLGSIFALALVLSPMNVLVLYGVVGLGMSLPYLALCVHPGFVDMLPKPGAWMDTLKQLLAFPLLFTVVFFFGSIGNDFRVATFLLLVFVWFACWMIGKVPAYANADRRLTAWASAVVVIALGTVVSFKFFGPVDHKLPWVDYNEPQLTALRKEGKTVMVDFTANWCWNCQVNMRVAIDKEGVAKVVEENGVVPMVADWTDRSPEIQKKLHELGSNSIPLLVVYPPDPNADPIVLPDLLTETQVVKALKEAGPSREGGKTARLLTSSSVH